MFGSFEIVKCKYLRKSQVWPGVEGGIRRRFFASPFEAQGKLRMTMGGGDDNKRSCHSERSEESQTVKGQ